MKRLILPLLLAVTNVNAQVSWIRPDVTGNKVELTRDHDQRCKNNSRLGSLTDENGKHLGCWNITHKGVYMKFLTHPLGYTWPAHTFYRNRTLSPMKSVPDTTSFFIAKYDNGNEVHLTAETCGNKKNLAYLFLRDGVTLTGCYDVSGEDVAIRFEEVPEVIKYPKADFIFDLHLNPKLPE